MINKYGETHVYVAVSLAFLPRVLVRNQAPRKYPSLVWILLADIILFLLSLPCWLSYVPIISKLINEMMQKVASFTHIDLWFRYTVLESYRFK